MKRLLVFVTMIGGAIIATLTFVMTSNDTPPLTEDLQGASKLHVASANQHVSQEAQPAQQEDGKRHANGQTPRQDNDGFLSWQPQDQEEGFEMQSFQTADMPERIKDDLKNDIDNLRKTGSFSGGRVTHEFAKADAARKELARAGSEQEFKKGLSYTPIKFEQILGPGFKLTGADYAGALVEGRGFGAGYYLYEGANAKVEISETPLGGEGGARNVTTLAETVNQYIAGKPATLETLSGRNGEPIVNVHWNSNVRTYSMSTMNMDKEAAIHLAERISLSADLADKK